MEAEEFDNHPLWGKPAQVAEVMAQMEPVAEQETATSDRIRFIAAQLAGYKSHDSRLFVQQQLVEADGLWTTTINHLQNHRNNPSGGYLSAALVQAETWLRSAGAWHKPQNNSTRLAQQAKAEYESLVESYRSANVTLAERLRAAEESAAAQSEEFEEKIGALNSSIAQTEKSLQSLQTAIAADQASMQTALTDHAEKFRAAQEKRGTDFTDWLGTQEVEFAGLAKPHINRIEESKDEAETVLKHIKSLGDQTDNAAGQTTGHILAENFKTSAAEELKAGNIAFWAGVACSVAGVGWLLYVALAGLSSGEESSWTWLSLKLALTLALGGVAAVLIRRGQHALATSRAYKRTELELRAIGPFLSDLEGRDAAEEAKISFLQRTFGRAWDGSSNGTEPPESDADFAAKAIDTMAALVSRLPKNPV